MVTTLLLQTHKNSHRVSMENHSNITLTNNIITNIGTIVGYTRIFFLIVIIILKACKFIFYYRFIGGISIQHQIDPLSKISGSLTGGIVLLPPFCSTHSFLVKGTSPISSNFFIVIELNCYYLMSFKRFMRINAMIASFHSNRLILQYISSDVVLNMRSAWQPPPQK